MPILPSEPDRFPEDLLQDSLTPGPAARLWWVLHTRPRQEKSVARHLHANRVPFYLPLIARRRRLRGHPVTTFIPLFPGYVFLWGHREERLLALTTQRVVRAIPVEDQAELATDLRQISRLIDTGAPITPEQRLTPGTVVEVRSGVLTGLRGKILREASGQRFVVQVNFIQQGASILLDDADLEIVRD